MRQVYPQLLFKLTEKAGDFTIIGEMAESAIRALESYVVEQSLEALKHRVSDVGGVGSTVEHQGHNRIMVTLIGVQNTAIAKRIISKRADLEFRFEALPKTSCVTKTWFKLHNNKAWSQVQGANLEHKVVVSGRDIMEASAGFDTVNRIGGHLGVLLVEYKIPIKGGVDALSTSSQVAERASVVLETLQSQLSAQFRITGFTITCQPP